MKNIFPSSENALVLTKLIKQEHVGQNLFYLQLKLQ